MSRHDEQEPVVFDLVEDNGPDGAVDVVPDAAGAASTDSPDRRLLRLPRLSRRTWLVAAAVVTVVAVTVAAVDLVRDQRRADLMRTSSVGVASLADPPEEVWTVPFDVPATEDQVWFMGQQLVTMDGLLVVPPGGDNVVDTSAGAADPTPVGFEDVVALDPGSGEVAWRVAVGDSPVCGPTGYDASTSTDTLVCVHGPENAREVLTIAPDGSTRSRAADLADGEQIFPGPDGMVVRVARIGDAGDAAEQVECNSMGACTPSVLTEGRDVLVTAEDAATGAERWTSTIEFAPVDAINCQQYDLAGKLTGIDPDQVTARAGAGMIDVDGCGVRGTVSTQGVRLDLAGGGDGSMQSWVTELGEGAFAVQVGAMSTVVVDGAGKTLRTLDGWVQTGARSPDAPDDLWFVTDGNGYGFDAVREDGSVAWTDRHSQGVLLNGRDVVVVDRGSKVAGLDRATGAELWTWSSEDTLGLARYRSLTDGETVALEHLPQEGQGGGLLVALDLDTGEQLWDAPVGGSPVAVDGHIVEITPAGLTGRG